MYIEIVNAFGIILFRMMLFNQYFMITCNISRKMIFRRLQSMGKFTMTFRERNLKMISIIDKSPYD